MEANLQADWAAAADHAMSDTFQRQRARLAAFIRRRVPDLADAEDILQEVLSEWVEAARLMRPVEQLGAWMYRVARNRIADLFRRRALVKFESLDAPAADDDDDASAVALEDLLPSTDAGPDAAFARRVLLEQLDEAIDELPPEQRWVFVAHEIEGRSFRELARESGESVNTLLSRKHYAVQRLRRRLRAVYEEFS
jgi:RNA polymerase sigma factor (sigma-70 family)